MPTPDMNNNDLLKYTEDVTDELVTKPGTSFSTAAMPANGYLATSAGGESAQPTSSDMGNSKTQLKNVHGVVDTITDPEQISNGAANIPVITLTTAQKDAMIGNTGPNISQLNDSGLQTINSNYNPTFTGVNNNLKPEVITNVANRFMR